MGPRMKLHDGDDELGDVFGQQHFCFPFVADRGGAVFEDGGVHFAGIDVGDPDAVGNFLAAGGDPQGPMAFFSFIENWRNDGRFEGLEFV